MCCRGDWLLRFLYRSASVQLSIAGLAAIDWQDRRMHNMDLSDVVSTISYLHARRDIDRSVENDIFEGCIQSCPLTYTERPKCR
jgi:hypothetical protein